jgi:non-canonical purine NTP pyrophosphatase (RdgB/HAM1 family)
MYLSFVTGNRGKFLEAEIVLKGWSLKQIELDLEEIQGSAQKIVIHKAMEACRAVKAPIFVEDVSIHLDALNGFPGPYIKDILKMLGYAGLADLVHRYDNHRAHAVCLVAYCEPGWEEPKIFEGKISGTIVKPQGELQHGKYSWNPIFQPDGIDSTFGEMSMEDHAKISHRKIALEQLKSYLQQRVIGK